MEFDNASTLLRSTPKIRQLAFTELLNNMVGDR